MVFKHLVPLTFFELQFILLHLIIYKALSLIIVLVDYGLVILCSVENEDRAYIVAALDQYRLNTAPGCPKQKDLQEYLRKQFLAPAKLHGNFRGSKLDWVPAAEVDAEK